jgi:hypothetical protein
LRRACPRSSTLASVTVPGLRWHDVFSRLPSGHPRMGKTSMKAQVACLSRLTLVCLLLAAPAIARPIPYSVTFLDSTGDEWTPDHGFRSSELVRLARASRGTLFDFGGALDDPFLAVSSSVSGLVSSQMTGFAFVPPNAVPSPIPEPTSLLVTICSGILGLASARVYYCRRARRLG